jgi:ketol-acid reductoisomerase
LVPDHVAGELLGELGPQLESRALVVFAAGYPLIFTPDCLPSHVDIVLVAPHGPGEKLRSGASLSGFVGVFQDVTGTAAERARDYARAIGLSPIFPTDPRDEALGDLFGEQTLLCGGLLSLAAAVTEVMLKHGLSKENVYFETVAQLEELTHLLKGRGIDGFWREISDCAAAGAAETGPHLIDSKFRDRLEQVWQQIESGDFARRFQAQGRPAEFPSSWRVLREISSPGKKKGRSK